MNLARFLVNGSASTPGGYDATNGQGLTFALEASSSLISRWTLEVYTPSDSAAPLASKSAPLLSLIGGTTGQKVDAATPAASITSTAPASGAHSYVVRSSINGGRDALGKPDPNLVFERMVVVRSAGGKRKIVASEGTQYEQAGWAGAQNEEVDNPGGGPGGPTLAIVDVPTTTLTLVRATHAGKYLRFTHVSGCTVTYNTGVFSDADVVYLRQTTAGQVVFTGSGTVVPPGSYLAKTAEIGATAAMVFRNSGAHGEISGQLEHA